jgi:hypothetical protein
MKFRLPIVLGMGTLLLASCTFLPAPTLAVPLMTLGSNPLPPPPPWNAPLNPLPGLDAIGIRHYLQETYDVHIHAHLDVFYQGQPVTVPAKLGFAPDGVYIAPLHTHTPTGVLHLEGPTGSSYTLGQLFTVWGVALQGATALDNGVPVTDPATMVLKDHHEVVVMFGTPPARVPAEYNGWLCIDLKLCE